MTEDQRLDLLLRASAHCISQDNSVVTALLRDLLGAADEACKLTTELAECKRQLSEQKAATATCCAIANTCMLEIAS
jgi:hypothetical protein